LDTKEYISSGILESYALGLASPEEAAILECVMKHNAEVRAAYDDTQKTLELLAESQAVEPPRHLKEKIWNRIREQESNIESKIPAKISGNSTPKASYMTSNFNWKIVAAAASVLFLMSLFGHVFWLSKTNQDEKEIAELRTKNESYQSSNKAISQQMAVLTNPDIRKISLNGVEKHADAKALVYWDTRTKQVYLKADRLPKAPDGMQYQLWAIADGKPVSAGLYSPDKNFGTAISAVKSAQAFAITLEKEGGSEIPTMENLYVLGNT